jgi:hypothetical protein
VEVGGGGRFGWEVGVVASGAAAFWLVLELVEVGGAGGRKYVGRECFGKKRFHVSRIVSERDPPDPAV